jgi:hypothetical protein
VSRGRGARRSRGTGRGARDRAHARPLARPEGPAAASAARVSAALERVLGRGITVTDVALALGVRGIDVARWRRGQPVPRYRRDEMEEKIARLRVVEDPESGARSVVVETPGA